MQKLYKKSISFDAKKRLDAKWEKGKQKVIQEALPGFCGFATKKKESSLDDFDIDQ